MSVLLVRVECLCGTIAAIPEGGFFPLCGQCGRRMVCPSRPGRGDHGHVRAYVATLMPEGEAVKVDRGEEMSEDEWRTNHVREYADEDLVARLEATGWPTEAQPWPARPSPDGLTYTAPPWEIAA